MHSLVNATFGSVKNRVNLTSDFHLTLTSYFYMLNEEWTFSNCKLAKLESNEFMLTKETCMYLKRFQTSPEKVLTKRIFVEYLDPWQTYLWTWKMSYVSIYRIRPWKKHTEKSMLVDNNDSSHGHWSWWSTTMKALLSQWSCWQSSSRSQLSAVQALAWPFGLW